MVSTDPISDMLTRIRNAISVRKSQVTLPYSKVKESVARLLQENRYIEQVEVVEDGAFKTLRLTLFPEEENTRITEIVRMSKPGRRLYAKVDEIPRVKNGRGVVIVSTSKGMMTDAEARKQRLGGELICKVY